MPPANLDAWKRLGLLLAARRIELGARYRNKNLFAEERELNRRMIWRIETGAQDSYRDDTLRAVEKAYTLVPGSLGRTLAGGDLEPADALPRPRPVPDPLPDPDAGPEDVIMDRFIADRAAEDPLLGELLTSIWRLRRGNGELYPREQRIRMVEAMLRPANSPEHRETGLPACSPLLFLNLRNEVATSSDLPEQDVNY